MAVKHLYPNQRPTLNLNFARSKTLDPRITFTRNSTATYVGSDGLIKTAAAGEARFDHDPVTGDCRGLLIEQTKTNQILNSQVFTSGFNKSGLNTITQNTTVTTPEGLTDGVGVITESSGGTVHQFYESSSIQVTGKKTYSIFVKPNGRNYCVLMTSSFTHDLVNGTTLGSASGEYLSATTTKFPNDWVRCTVTLNHSNSYDQFNFKLAKDGHQDYSYSGDGMSGVYVWGAQIEQGDLNTSYIPTSGSTYQRLDDEVSITGTNFSSWYNGSEGTMVMDMIRKPVYSSGVYLEFYNNKGFFLQDSGNDFKIRIGAESNISTLGQFATTTNYRIAAGYTSAADWRFAVNGGNISGIKTTAVNFNNATELHIGRGNNAFGAHWRNGPTTFTLRQFAFYPTRLTNSQLQELTR